jgi:tetratricopeptide (TPR) repeat protein
MEGRFTEAEPLLARALESRRRILGSNHPDTLATSAWLGQLYAELATPESMEQAEKLLTATLESGGRILGKEDPIVLEAMYGLAFLRGAVLGRTVEATSTCDEGCKAARKVLGEGHRLTCRFMSLAAWYEAWTGQFEEAVRHASTALKVNRAVLGEEHPETLNALCTLGMVHAHQYNLDEAEALLGPEVEGLRRTLKERSAEVFFYWRWLAWVYLCQHRYEEVEGLLKQVITEGGSLLGGDHLITMGARVNMMFLYAMQGQGGKLQRWCQQEIESLEAQSGDHRLTMAWTWGCLGWLQATYPSSAIRNGDKAVENAMKAADVFGRDNAISLFTLAAAYAELGDFDKAVAYEEKAVSAPTYPDYGVLSPEYLRYVMSLYASHRAIREGILTEDVRLQIAKGDYDAAEQALI